MSAAPSGRLKAFVAVVSIAGLAAVAHSTVLLPLTPHPLHWMVLGALASLASAFALTVPGIPAQVSVSDTFFFTSALLFGPAPATVAIALDSLLISWRSRHPAHRILFNAGNPALALWTGSHAFFALSGTGPLADAVSTRPGAILLPLLVMAALYFTINTGFIAVAVAWDKGASIMSLWYRHFAVVSLYHLAAASASFFLVVTVRSVSVFALGAALPLLLLFQIALRSGLGRLSDAQRHVAEVDRLHLSTIEALSAAIEAKDGVTSAHLRRVQQLALALARKLGIDDASTLKAIQAASLLHDTGKLAIPERILNKPGALRPAELEIMKRHVDVGADILSAVDFPYPVVPIVRCHHENWDGTGYPGGLKGEEIPIGARILAVVDCFDAVTSDRPYKPGRTEEQAIEILLRGKGTVYDPRVVDAFVEVHGSVTLEAASQPELDQAIRSISRGADDGGTEWMPTSSRPALGIPEGDAAALTSLSQVVLGRPTVPDVARLVWVQLQSVVAPTSGLFFGLSSSEDEIVVRFAAGPQTDGLLGRTISVGHRISGWVAVHRQPIVNSDARLDLGVGCVEGGLRCATSFPLVHAARLVGVVTLYGPTRFEDDHIRRLEAMAPRLAEILDRTIGFERSGIGERRTLEGPGDLHMII